MCNYHLKDGDEIYCSVVSETLVDERAPLKTLCVSNTVIQTHRSNRTTNGKSKRSKRKKAIQTIKTEEKMQEDKAKHNLRLWMDIIAHVHVEGFTLRNYLNIQ